MRKRLKKLYLSKKYSGKYIGHTSTKKQIPTKDVEIMNYSNYTTDQISKRLSGISD